MASQGSEFSPGSDTASCRPQPIEASSFSHSPLQPHVVELQPLLFPGGEVASPGPLLVGTVVRPSRYCKQGVALPSGSLKPSEDAACMHGVQPGRQVKLRTTKGMLASSKK